jgi:hypothetical protein
MNPSYKEPTSYIIHDGTVRIAGGTDCKKAAKCALHFLRKGIKVVDFFYLGANAGQQAMKAMGLMRLIFETATEGKMTVVFQPNAAKTMVRDQATFQDVEKDAVYWRVSVIAIEDLEKAVAHGTTIGAPIIDT